MNDSKTFVRQINQHVSLHRDKNTGIAWVEDRTAGLIHSPHPNIGKKSTVQWMRNRGYWQKTDRVVECQGWKYNIDMCSLGTNLDRLAAYECQCSGNHGHPLFKVHMLAYAEPPTERYVVVPQDIVGQVDVAELLHMIVCYGQNDLQPLTKIPSVSVGDVIELRTGREPNTSLSFWVVRYTGFTNLSPEQFKEFRKIPRHDRLLHLYVKG